MHLQRAKSAIMIAMVIVTAHAQDTASPGKAIEGAKNDLQALSLGNLDLAKKNPFKLEIPEIPGLQLLSPTQAPRKPSDSATLPASAGPDWLKDGLKLTELQSLDRRRNQGRNARESLALREASSASTNPLSSYLEQWLAPRDRTALSAEKAGGKRDTDNDFSPAIQRLGRDLVPVGLTNAPSPQPLGRTPNPYLSGADTSLFDASGALTLAPMDTPTIAPAKQVVTPLLRQRTAPPSTAYPHSGQQTPPPESLPATAPWVDEGKYFPQLRRF